MSEVRSLADDGNVAENWFRDCQLLVPMLLSLPQQNAPSGQRVPS
jgi:hypothetical protein